MSEATAAVVDAGRALPDIEGIDSANGWLSPSGRLVAVGHASGRGVAVTCIAAGEGWGQRWQSSCEPSAGVQWVQLQGGGEAFFSMGRSAVRQQGSCEGVAAEHASLPEDDLQRRMFIRRAQELLLHHPADPAGGEAEPCAAACQPIAIPLPLSYTPPTRGVTLALPNAMLSPHSLHLLSVEHEELVLYTVSASVVPSRLQEAPRHRLPFEEPVAADHVVAWSACGQHVACIVQTPHEGAPHSTHVAVWLRQSPWGAPQARLGARGGGSGGYQLIYHADASRWAWVPSRVLLLRQHAVVWGATDGFVLDVARADRMGEAERLWQSGGGGKHTAEPARVSFGDDVASVSSMASARTSMTATTVATRQAPQSSFRVDALQQAFAASPTATRRSALCRMSTRLRGAPVKQLRMAPPVALDVSRDYDMSRLPRPLVKHLDRAGAVQVVCTLDAVCLIVTPEESGHAVVHFARCSDLRWHEIALPRPGGHIYAGSTQAASPVSGMPLMLAWDPAEPLGGALSAHLLAPAEGLGSLFAASAVMSGRVHAAPCDLSQCDMHATWVKRAVACRDPAEFAKALQQAGALSPDERQALGRRALVWLAVMCSGRSPAGESPFAAADLSTPEGVQAFEALLRSDTGDTVTPTPGSSVLRAMSPYLKPLSSFVLGVLQEHPDATLMLLLRRFYARLLDASTPSSGTAAAAPPQGGVPSADAAGLQLLLKASAVLPRRWSRMFVEGVCSAAPAEADPEEEGGSRPAGAPSAGPVHVEAALASCAFLFTVEDLARVTRPAPFSPGLSTADGEEWDESALHSGSDGGSGPRAPPGGAVDLMGAKQRIAEVALEAGLGVLQSCLNLNRAAFASGLYMRCIKEGAPAAAEEMMRKAENRSALLWGWMASGALVDFESDPRVAAIQRELEARSASNTLPALEDALATPLPFEVVVSALTRIAVDLLAARSGVMEAAAANLLKLCFMSPHPAGRTGWQRVMQGIALVTVDAKVRSRVLARLRHDGIPFPDSEAGVADNEGFLSSVRGNLTAKKWAAGPAVAPASDPPVYPPTCTATLLGALNARAGRAASELCQVTPRSITDTGSAPCPAAFRPSRSGPFLRVSLRWAAEWSGETKAAVLVESSRSGAASAAASVEACEEGVPGWCRRRGDVQLAWAYGAERGYAPGGGGGAADSAMAEAACRGGHQAGVPLGLRIAALCRSGQLLRSDPPVPLGDLLQHVEAPLLRAACIDAGGQWREALLERGRLTPTLVTHAAHAGFCEGVREGTEDARWGLFAAVAAAEAQARGLPCVAPQGGDVPQSVLAEYAHGTMQQLLADAATGDPLPLVLCAAHSGLPLQELGLPTAALREAVRRVSPALADVVLPGEPEAVAPVEPEGVCSEGGALSVDFVSPEGGTSLLQMFSSSTSLVCEPGSITGAHLAKVLHTAHDGAGPVLSPVALHFAACTGVVDPLCPAPKDILDLAYFLRQGRPFAALEHCVRFTLEDCWDSEAGAGAACDPAARRMLRDVACGSLDAVLRQEGAGAFTDLTATLQAVCSEEGPASQCGVTASLRDVLACVLADIGNAELVRAALVFFTFFRIPAEAVAVDLVAFREITSHYAQGGEAVPHDFTPDFLAVFADHLEGTARTAETQRAAQRILDTWEGITGVAESQRADASVREPPSAMWALLTVFSRHHHLEPFVRHLTTAMAAGDWPAVLWGAQHSDVQTATLAKLIMDLPGTESPGSRTAAEAAAPQHVLASLKAAGAQLPPVQHPPNSLAALCLGTLLPLGRARPATLTEELAVASTLYRAALLRATPVVAVLAGSACPSVHPLVSFVAFLLAALLGGAPEEEGRHSPVSGPASPLSDPPDTPCSALPTEVTLEGLAALAVGQPARQATPTGGAEDCLNNTASSVPAGVRTAPPAAEHLAYHALLGEPCLQWLVGAGGEPSAESAQRVLDTLLKHRLPGEVWDDPLEGRPRQRPVLLFAAGRGADVFLPESQLRTVLQLCRAALRCDWGAVPALAAPLCADGSCGPLVLHLLRSAPQEQTRLVFLEALEKGGFSPTAHGLLPAKVVRLVEAAVSQADALERVRLAKRRAAGVRHAGGAASPRAAAPRAGLAAHPDGEGVHGTVARLSFSRQPFPMRSVGASFATESACVDGVSSRGGSMPVIPTDSPAQSLAEALGADWRCLSVGDLVAALQRIKLFATAEQVLQCHPQQHARSGLQAAGAVHTTLSSLLSAKWLIVPQVLIAAEQEQRPRGLSAGRLSKTTSGAVYGVEGAKAVLGARGVALVRTLGAQRSVHEGGTGGDAVLSAVGVGICAVDVLLPLQDVDTRAHTAGSTEDAVAVSDIAVVAALSVGVGIHSVRVTHIAALEYLYAVAMFALGSLSAASASEDTAKPLPLLQRRIHLLESVAQRIASQRQDILSAFYYFEPRHDFAKKLRSASSLLVAAVSPASAPDEVPAAITDLDTACAVATATPQRAKADHGSPLLASLYTEAKLLPATAELLGGTGSSAVSGSPLATLSQQAGAHSAPGSAVPAEDETVVLVATVLAHPDSAEVIARSEGMREKARLVLPGCGYPADWWEGEGKPAADVRAVLQAMQQRSVQTVTARHELRRLAVLVEAADLTRTNLHHLSSMTPQELYSALLHTACLVRQGAAALWQRAVGLLSDVVEVYSIPADDVSRLAAEAIVKWGYAGLALRAAALKKLAFVISDYVGGNDAAAAAAGSTASSPRMTDLSAGDEASDEASYERRSILQSLCEEDYFVAAEQADAPAPDLGTMRTTLDDRMSVAETHDHRTAPERSQLIAAVQSVFRPFFATELDTEQRNDAKPQVQFPGSAELPHVVCYGRLFYSEAEVAPQEVSRLAEQLGSLINVGKDDLQQLVGAGGVGVLALARELLKRATDIRRGIKGCSGPPPHWLSSVALDVAVVSLVHASWLGEKHFDPTLHTMLLSEAHSLLREALHVNEVEAVTPLILCGSFRSEALAEEIMSLLLSRSATHAVLHLFTCNPSEWTEAHCSVYQYLQRRVVSSTQCRELLVSIYTKLALYVNLGELLEAQAHTRIRECINQAASLTLMPSASPPQSRYSKTKKKMRYSSSGTVARARGFSLATSAMSTSRDSVPATPPNASPRDTSLSGGGFAAAAHGYFEGDGTYSEASNIAAEALQAMNVASRGAFADRVSSPPNPSLSASPKFPGSASMRRDSAMADALRSQNLLLTKASALLRSAASWYVRGKCCASVRRCLNVADLLDLQCKTLIAERRVILINESSARAVLCDLPEFADALVVARAYGLNSTTDWVVAVHTQVTMNQSRAYWDEFFDTMPYTPEIFSDLVQMLYAQKHSKREMEMMRFIMRDCKDKALVDEVMASKKRRSVGA